MMFEIPSDPTIEKCIITKETIINNAEPIKIVNENRKKENKNKRKNISKPGKETA